MGFFGPGRKEVWEQLSKELNTDIVEGDFWNGDRIEVTHDNWTLYLDTDTIPTGDSTITYTRMRAPFISKDGLMFKIYKSSIFSGIGKILGMQDIEVGYNCFDEDFIIKGNNEDQIIKLFNNEHIRDLIVKQPELCLEIKSTEGTDDNDDDKELYFNMVGNITDIERLKQLFDLFMAVLNEMVLIGSAYTKAPDVVIFEDDE